MTSIWYHRKKVGLNDVTVGRGRKEVRSGDWWLDPKISAISPLKICRTVQPTKGGDWGQLGVRDTLIHNLTPHSHSSLTLKFYKEKRIEPTMDSIVIVAAGITAITQIANKVLDIWILQIEKEAERKKMILEHELRKEEMLEKRKEKKEGEEEKARAESSAKEFEKNWRLEVEEKA